MTMGDAHRPRAHPHASLVELAVALGDVDSALLIADDARSCPACAQALSEDQQLDDQARPPGEAGEAPEPPPFDRVLAAARARRRPAPRVPSFAAPFAVTAGMLDAVLAAVNDDVLRQPSPVPAWSLGDLVAHLAAGNALLAAAIDLPVEPEPATGAGFVGHTGRLLSWTAGWPPARVRELWRRDVEAIAARLRAEPGLARRQVEVGAARMPVEDHLVSRAFETWIHARDMGVAAGLRVPPPPTGSLAAMADLAARVLNILPPREPAAPTGAVRLTLTGPGGGSWLVRVGGADTDATAEVTLDAVGFCLLVADRGRPARADVQIDGDAALAAELLATAPQLARP